MIQQFYPWAYIQRKPVQKDTNTSMFTAALFTTATGQKKPKCLSTDEGIKKLWYIYRMEYYSVIKRMDNAICSNMNGPRDFHTKSNRERQISQATTHVQNLILEMTQVNLFTNRNRLTDSENKLYNYHRGNVVWGGRDKSGAWD